MKTDFFKTGLKQFIFLILCIVFLFLITYSDFEVKESDFINTDVEINAINNKHVSARELFLDSWFIVKNNYYLNDLNKQDWIRWKKRYYHKIQTEEDAYVAINSMLASLNDSYTKFMDKEEFREQNNALNSKLYGIGINIASVSGKIQIINVLLNTPAYQAGIRPDDIILKVNNIDINGDLNKTTQLIRNSNSDEISLELLRGVDKFTKNVKREEIKVKTIDYKKLTDEIGYIKISSFIGVDTPKEFIIALNRLKDSKGLILDLRGNPGGLFQNAIVISNLFMNQGTIVNVIARQGKKNTYNAQNDGCIYDNKLVVLIDNDSASASEILSSALHDNKRAVLIGTKTYGKGLVQKIFPLPNKSGMNLTIARYLTPSGADINRRGIEPDYYVNIVHNDFRDSIDSQLIYAKNYLEKELQRY